MIINLYCTAREIPPLSFAHTLNNRRDRSDPELGEHLDGFVGYLMNAVGGKMTSDMYALVRHVQRVRHHLSITVTELPEGLAEWSLRAIAIAFYQDGSVRDPRGFTLLDPRDGSRDPRATTPYGRDARERKERTHVQLEASGVRVPASLPPTVGVEEAVPREPGDVARRALALLTVALRAESINTGEPWPAAEICERFPRGCAALSPVEAAFMASDQPEEQEVVNHAWRYEALWVLLWALGAVADMPFPNAICDVKTAARSATAASEDAFIAGARLRPTGELLDTADLHYRLHWAVRQATQIDHQAPPAELDPGVVMERRHALNWLLRFEDADWDDVDTPT